MSAHPCAFQPCKVRDVPDEHLLCEVHWMVLPGRLRRNLYNASTGLWPHRRARPLGMPRPEYLQAAKEALAFLGTLGRLGLPVDSTSPRSLGNRR
jgi:hypothetical protein